MTLETCDDCLVGKQHRISFKRYSHSTKSNVCDVVYSDLCGPMKVKTLGGALYFLTCVDDHSWKVWAYTLKSKDQVLDMFQQFQARVRRDTGRKMKCIHTDNDNAYLDLFDKYCTEQGITHEKTSQRHLRRTTLSRGCSKPSWRGFGVWYDTPNCQNILGWGNENSNWSYKPISFSSPEWTHTRESLDR